MGLPDLPGVPSHLSLEEVAELYRFLDARDLRRGLWPTALARFEAGVGDPEVEAEPVDEEGRMVAKCGEVLTASGHRFHAVLLLEGGRGFDTFQNYGTVLVVPTFEAGKLDDFVIVSQDREDFAEVLAQLKRRPPYTDLEVTPYAYRYYDASTYEQDPRVDERTGWSRSGGGVMEKILGRCLSAPGERS